MYLPPHFHITNEQTAYDFIISNPFATITTCLEGELQANHIPLQVSNESSAPKKLFGHLARSNPLVDKLQEPTSCLSIFHGPDCYITPNWYETKKQTGMVVPTWDYQVVHVRGMIKLVDDEEWLLSCLNALTNEHEAKQAAPWKVSDAPDNFIRDKLKAIIGIVIDIQEISMKSKLNQNHPISNQIGIVEGITNASESTEKEQQIAAQINNSLDSAF